MKVSIKAAPDTTVSEEFRDAFVQLMLAHGLSKVSYTHKFVGLATELVPDCAYMHVRAEVPKSVLEARGVVTNALANLLALHCILEVTVESKDTPSDMMELNKIETAWKKLNEEENNGTTGA
jgi:hypothetical protein